MRERSLEPLRCGECGLGMRVGFGSMPLKHVWRYDGSALPGSTSGVALHDNTLCTAPVVCGLGATCGVCLLV